MTSPRHLRDLEDIQIIKGILDEAEKTFIDAEMSYERYLDSLQKVSRGNPKQYKTDFLGQKVLYLAALARFLGHTHFNSYLQDIYGIRFFGQYPQTIQDELATITKRRRGLMRKIIDLCSKIGTRVELTNAQICSRINAILNTNVENLRELDLAVVRHFREENIDNIANFKDRYILLENEFVDYKTSRGTSSTKANPQSNQLKSVSDVQSLNESFGGIINSEEFFQSNNNEILTYEDYLLDLGTNGVTENTSDSFPQQRESSNLENWWFVAVPASGASASTTNQTVSARLLSSSSKALNHALARFTPIILSAGIVCYVMDQMFNMNDYRHSRDVNFASTNEIINQQILGYQINGQNFDANYDVLSPNINQYDGTDFGNMHLHNHQNTMIYAYPKSQYSFEDLKSIHIALGQG